MTFIPEKEKRKMVRVISCHHFQAQDIFTVDGEPVALCTVDDNLLIATLQHCVEVWDLQNPGKYLHSFPTVDQAKQMVYCRKGHYIGALEVRASRTSVLSFVRVYLNWQVDMKGQPMRARIAGRVTPSSQSNVGLLEMIELPLQKQAFCISTCSQTGNLAVGLGEVVSLFRFCLKTHDISKRTFHDLEPLVDITLSLSAHHLALCEDVIACLSPTELHVIKLKIQKDSLESSDTTPLATPVDKKKGDVLMRSPELQPPINFDADNFIVEDENFVIWTFEDSPTESKLLKDKLHPDSWPLVVQLPGLMEPSYENKIPPSEMREVLGPSVIFPVKVNLVGESDLMVVPITLLYRRFSLEDEINIGLHSLHLIPVYCNDLPVESTNDDNPLRSSKLSQLCGLTCFFSSPQQGFLYDLTGSVHLIVTYPYTCSARAVAIENHLLHAITEAGLETYTLRSMHAALKHLPKNVNDLMFSLPALEDPVCLVGLQAFFNIEQIALSKTRLILMATSTDESSSSQESDSNGWTVYSITKSTPEEFYHDLVEVATTNRKKSPQTYVHLLSEAHCVLRGEMIIRDKLDTNIKHLYRESCCLLGDFFLMSENSEENKLAVGYYLISESPIQDVVSRVLELWGQVHPMPLPVKGLINYLNHFLLQGERKSIEVSQSMADTILDLYADNEPNTLAVVLLKDRLAGYNSSKAASLIKKRILNKKALPEDMIALSCLCLINEQSEQATSLLATVPKERLVDTVVKNYEVWITVENTFSIFAQLVRQWRPDYFVEVTLQLVFHDILDANEVLKMFRIAAPDVEIHKIRHFKEFLEALLTASGSGTEVWASETPVWLAKIYLARSKEGPQSRSQPLLKALNLFGSRASWVNALPPFEGRSLREPCRNKQLKGLETVSCPCWECNEELLRLQSLMFHESCPPEVGKAVIEYLDSNGPTFGELSLRVLSGTPAEAVTLLADNFPVALVQYGKDCFEDNVDKWQIVIDSITSKMDLSLPESEQFKLFRDALHLLLLHLAEILPPISLLNLLPTNDDSAMYFPYVQRCCQKHQARLLRNQIIAKGLELKAAV